MKECRFVPVPCPNGCKTQQLLKENLSGHLHSCPNRRYEGESCRKKGTNSLRTPTKPRKCSRKLFTPEREQALGGTVENSRQQVRGLNSKDAFSFTVSGYSKLKRSGLNFKCDPFYSPGGHSLHAVVSCNGSGWAKGTHLSVHVEALWGSAYNRELQWPLLGTVTVLLINQCDDTQNHTQTVNLMAPRPSGLMNLTAARLDQFIAHPQLSQGAGSHAYYLMHDTIVFKVKVDLSRESFPIIILDSALCQMKYLSGCGGEIFEFPISNYSAEEKYRSEFCSRSGSVIKACLSTGKDHLCVAVDVLGKQLTDAHPGTVVAELVNLLEDRNHHTRQLPVVRNHASSGCTRRHENFIHWKQLLRTIKMDGSTSFLENDFLMFRLILLPEEDGDSELEEGGRGWDHMF